MQGAGKLPSQYDDQIRSVLELLTKAWWPEPVCQVLTPNLLNIGMFLRRIAALVANELKVAGTKVCSDS
jgi:hypothetical protein